VRAIRRSEDQKIRKGEPLIKRDPRITILTSVSWNPMARIFNRRTGSEILFDSSSIGIVLMPIEEPEDRPHVLVELMGIDLEDHSHKCPECRELLKDLGTSTTDWHIELDEKVYRLHLEKVDPTSNPGIAKPPLREFFDGTRLKLRIDTDTVEGLESELKRHEEDENYEHCVYLRDRIRQLKAEM
jgi:hypothetical protein